MLLQSLSLVHQIRKPGIDSFSPPPLLLLLHGIGCNEEDLMDVSSQFDKRFFIVSARAPITLKPGSYAWFSINFTPTETAFAVQDVESCRLLLSHFIDELIEAYRLESRQVYAMGFSQGAIMSFVLAMNQPDKLAGIVAMSGRVPTETLPQIDNLEALAGLPIFISHGTADSVLSIAHGRASRDFLNSLHVELTYREYFMGHQVSPESLKDIGIWLGQQMDLSITRRPRKQNLCILQNT